MSDQLPLPLESDADRRFRQFHAKHPEVFEELTRVCRRWRAFDQSKWSVKGAFEVLRWERREGLRHDAGEDYLLNNNYHSRYARELMKLPDLAGLFDLRGLRS